MNKEVEVISGVKTTWHSGKESTLQKMADLLFTLLYENEIERLKEVDDHEQEL